MDALVSTEELMVSCSHISTINGNSGFRGRNTNTVLEPDKDSKKVGDFEHIQEPWPYKH
jgi:hypothetical protein